MSDWGEKKHKNQYETNENQARKGIHEYEKQTDTQSSKQTNSKAKARRH